MLVKASKIKTSSNLKVEFCPEKSESLSKEEWKIIQRKVRVCPIKSKKVRYIPEKSEKMCIDCTFNIIQ